MFIAGPTLGFMALLKKGTFSRGSAARISVCAELHQNHNESIQLGTGNFTNILVFTLKSDKLFQIPCNSVCKYAKTIVMHFLASFMQSEVESDVDLMYKY